MYILHGIRRTGSQNPSLPIASVNKGEGEGGHGLYAAVRLLIRAVVYKRPSFPSP